MKTEYEIVLTRDVLLGLKCFDGMMIPLIAIVSLEQPQNYKLEGDKSIYLGSTTPTENCPKLRVTFTEKS